MISWTFSIACVDWHTTPAFFIFLIFTASSGDAIGDIWKFGGSSTVGKIHYLKGNGEWGAAQANSTGTSTGSLAVALGSSAVNDGMVFRGLVKLAADPVGISSPLSLN